MFPSYLSLLLGLSGNPYQQSGSSYEYTGLHPGSALGGDWTGYNGASLPANNPVADPRAVYDLTGGRWGQPAGPFDSLGTGMRRFFDGYGQSLNELWQMYLNR